MIVSSTALHQLAQTRPVPPPVPAEPVSNQGRTAFDPSITDILVTIAQKSLYSCHVESTIMVHLPRSWWLLCAWFYTTMRL